MATTENLTILFTDIVGFTERTSMQTRSQNEAMLRDHDTLLRPLVKQFSGKYIKSIGDAMLITFRSATNALFCAMAMHDALFEFNKDKSEEDSITIRAALNTGDIRLEDGDVFGEAVNIAARLEGVTPARNIYFTESVYLSMNRAEVQAESVGANSFKGIPEKINIYRVKPQKKDISKCPFGGMHLDSSHAAQSLRQLSNDAAEAFQSNKVIWGVVGIVIPLIVISLYSLDFTGKEDEPVPQVMVPAPSVVNKEVIEAVLEEAKIEKPRRNFIVEAERLLQEKRIEAATQVYRDALAEDPRSATSLLLEGHIDFANKKRKKGLAVYEKALEINPEFSSNIFLVDNLVEALGRTTKPARRLLVKYQSMDMIDGLTIRSVEPHYWGRNHAISILRSIGQAERIDEETAALLNFKEGDTCARKKAAVVWLGKLKSNKALPLLKPIANAGFFDGLSDEYSCLVEEAKRSVALIDGKPFVPKKQAAPVKADDSFTKDILNF